MRNCLTCHFLCKSTREENTGRELVFVLNEKVRNSLKKDPVGYDRGWYSLQCNMGVWDEGVAPALTSNDPNLFVKERGRSCFFILYQPSMLLPAAREIQKRTESMNELKSNQRLTIVGLYIAGFGLILNALATIYEVANK